MWAAVIPATALIRARGTSVITINGGNFSLEAAFLERKCRPCNIWSSRTWLPRFGNVIRRQGSIVTRLSGEIYLFRLHRYNPSLNLCPRKMHSSDLAFERNKRSIALVRQHWFGKNSLELLNDADGDDDGGGCVLKFHFRFSKLKNDCRLNGRCRCCRPSSQAINSGKLFYLFNAIFKNRILFLT